MADGVDERRDAERVGEEDELLARVVALLPVSVRKRMAVNHSASVSATSRTKSCRCRVRLRMICSTRGSAVASSVRSTSSVTVCSVKSGIATSPFDRYTPR
jgi:hypothetical protein